MFNNRQEVWKFQSPVWLMGFLMLLFAATVLLVPEAGIAPLSQALGDFRDAMHYPFFVVITVLTLVMFGGPEESWARRSRWIAVGVMVFAGGTEILQGLSDRSPSWLDFILNFNGILVGYYLVFYSRRRNRVVVFILVVAALVCALVAAWSPLTVWRAKLAQRDALPVLFDASQPLARALIEAKDGTAVRVDDGLLWVSCTPGAWRGVNLSIASGLGWSEWDVLEVRIRNNAHAFNGGIRLDGEGAGRASTFFYCPAGESTVRVAKPEFDGDRDAVWLNPSDVLIHLGAEGGDADFAIEEIRLVKLKE